VRYRESLQLHNSGYVWTPLVDNQILETMEARNMTGDQRRPVRGPAYKEFGTIEQVASLALFRCSDDAAQITGANFCIDGGWRAA
jgi:3-hydroxybutyrate dehydrogenase